MSSVSKVAKKSSLLSFIFSLSLLIIPYSYAQTTSSANSNINSREVASALGGLKNQSYEPEQAPTIKVATFNMAAGKVANMESIAKAIKAMDVDIVAIN